MDFLMAGNSASAGPPERWKISHSPTLQWFMVKHSLGETLKVIKSFQEAWTLVQLVIPGPQVGDHYVRLLYCWTHICKSFDYVLKIFAFIKQYIFNRLRSYLY